jgi:hypothetical protein
MAVPTAYLKTTKNTVAILDAMKRAGVPDTFTYDFLKKNLGFGSSSDRPHIPVFKALGFLSENGSPTERYRRFKDGSQSAAVIAEALRDAYADVFAADQNAGALSPNELQGLFARLSDKGHAVTVKMATTFKAFADLADWSATSAPLGRPTDPEPPGEREKEEPKVGAGAIVMHHDIHVHLPVSTEIAVYDAIFRSLRQHLGV